ncbi:hypothetical protein SNEBB_005227 [Seison nebaliae]|nr:hypothetical protein SNEBB_005227 [Seison nebaliae]
MVQCFSTKNVDNRLFSQEFAANGFSTLAEEYNVRNCEKLCERNEPYFRIMTRDLPEEQPDRASSFESPIFSCATQFKNKEINCESLGAEIFFLLFAQLPTELQQELKKECLQLDSLQEDELQVFKHPILGLKTVIHPKINWHRDMFRLLTSHGYTYRPETRSYILITGKCPGLRIIKIAQPFCLQNMLLVRLIQAYDCIFPNSRCDHLYKYRIGDPLIDQMGKLNVSMDNVEFSVGVGNCTKDCFYKYQCYRLRHNILLRLFNEKVVPFMSFKNVPIFNDSDSTCNITAHINRVVRQGVYVNNNRIVLGSPNNYWMLFGEQLPFNEIRQRNKRAAAIFPPVQIYQQRQLTKQVQPNVWSAWSTWSSCDVDCGKSEVKRTRQCLVPSSPWLCVDKSEETRECIEPCWSAWSDWSDCTVNCGHGLENRYRNCRFRREEVCREKFAGESYETRECVGKNGHDCIKYYLTEWSDWTPCTSTCGEGLKTRKRRCLKEDNTRKKRRISVLTLRKHQSLRIRREISDDEEEETSRSVIVNRAINICKVEPAFIETDTATCIAICPNDTPNWLVSLSVVFFLANLSLIILIIIITIYFKRYKKEETMRTFSHMNN